MKLRIFVIGLLVLSMLRPLRADLLQIDSPATLRRVEREIANRVLLDKLEKAGVPSDIKLDPLFDEYSLEDLQQMIQSIHHGQIKPVQQFVAAAAMDVKRDRNIAATAALIPTVLLNKRTDGDYDLNVSFDTLGKALSLCIGEEFENEPAIANCAAVLVAPRLAVTAGHCVEAFKHVNLSAVFGYQRVGTDQHPQPKYPSTDIACITDVIEVTNHDFGQDWAIITLDHDIARDAVPIRTTGAIGDADGVYVVGYPGGMPETIANGATVTNNTANDTFLADIDTLERSSGSPVFHARSNELEGIFAHGDKVYSAGNCNLIQRCHGGPSCADEEVTRIRCLPLGTDANGKLVVTGASSQQCK